MAAKSSTLAAKSHARNSIFSHRARDQAAAVGPAVAENGHCGQRGGGDQERPGDNPRVLAIRTARIRGRRGRVGGCR